MIACKICRKEPFKNEPKEPKEPKEDDKMKLKGSHFGLRSEDWVCQSCIDSCICQDCNMVYVKAEKINDGKHGRLVLRPYCYLEYQCYQCIIDEKIQMNKEKKHKKSLPLQPVIAQELFAKYETTFSLEDLKTLAQILCPVRKLKKFYFNKEKKQKRELITMIYITLGEFIKNNFQYQQTYAENFVKCIGNFEKQIFNSNLVAQTEKPNGSKFY